MSEVYEYTPNPPCNLPSGPCEPCSELAQIEAQMDPGQKDLHVMHLAIRRRRNSIHCYISNLPYDIASYIFVLCLPPIYPSYRSPAECLAIETPRPTLELCAVCHDWRSLALSTPELWCRISIKAGAPHFPSLSQRLQLAGPAPLFIRLNYSPSLDCLNSIRDTIAFVKQNLHRTRYLCLKLSNYYLERLESQCKFDRPNAAPLLQELHLHCIYPKKPYDLNLSILPRRVSIDGNIANFSNLNWDHVSHLTIGSGMSFNDIVPLLSKAKNVINFDVHLPITSSTPPLAMMTHSSIQILTIRYDRGNGSILLLSHSTLPSLEKLTIFSLHPNFFLGFSQSCLSFLLRSACHLKSLDITFEEFNTCTLQALEVLLLQTPTIQELSFRSSYWHWPNLKTLLERLRSVNNVSSDHGQNTLLPHLRKFSYHGRSNMHLDLFLDIMMNRSTSSDAFQTHQPMDELVIHYTNSNVKIRRTDLQRILQLRAAGKSVFVGAACRDFWDCRTRDLVKLAMERYELEGHFVMPETYYGDWTLLENVIDDTL